jgi:hypothetical protein
MEEYLTFTSYWGSEDIRDALDNPSVMADLSMIVADQFVEWAEEFRIEQGKDYCEGPQHDAGCPYGEEQQ